MYFRTATKADLGEMQELFLQTIKTVCENDYDELQLEAWSSAVYNTEYWLEVIANQFTLLVLIQDKIVGYGTLRKGNYIDFFYVHSAFQRQGIASVILLQLKEKAKNFNSKKITADVSITAKPFFEKKGFVVIKEQRISRNGTILINYKMETEFYI